MQAALRQAAVLPLGFSNKPFYQKEEEPKVRKINHFKSDFSRKILYSSSSQNIRLYAKKHLIISFISFFVLMFRKLLYLKILSLKRTAVQGAETVRTRLRALHSSG